jgi:hypothetical protein
MRLVMTALLLAFSGTGCSHVTPETARPQAVSPAGVAANQKLKDGASQPVPPLPPVPPPDPAAQARALARAAASEEVRRTEKCGEAGTVCQIGPDGRNTCRCRTQWELGEKSKGSNAPYESPLYMGEVGSASELDGRVAPPVSR